MEFYAEILAHYLAKERSYLLFPDLKLNAQQIVELQCYQALKEIKRIIDDDSLEDPECFERIEQIVCVLERIGTDGGSRHDFG